MARYAIKHIPTGKYWFEDEGGAFLVDKDEGFYTYGNKQEAETLFTDFKSQGTVFCEDFENEISTEEFELIEL